MRARLGRQRCWRIWRCCLAILPGLIEPACAFDHAAAAQRALDRFIRPDYARFDAAAKALSDTAKALCRSPSAETLAAAREAARAAMLAFARVEVIRFGPITEARRLDRLVFYPDPRAIARRQIAALLRSRDEAALAPGRLAGASIAVQGFTAIDHALFARGSDILGVAPGDTFRCRYVETLADGIAQTAAATRKAWSGPFGRRWLNPGKDNGTFLSSRETTQMLFRAYITQLGVLRLQRLAPVLVAVGKHRASPVPIFPDSRFSLAYLLAAVDGTRDLIAQSGFTDRSLAETENERAAMDVLDSVLTDLAFAERAGHAAPAEALSDEREHDRLTPMLLALKNAEETGRSALTELTGLSIGFNSLDGD